MNGCEVTKPSPADPQKSIDAVVGAMVHLGYVLKKRKSTEVKLKFAGSWGASDPDKATHYLTVSAHNGSVKFEFSTGILASYWTEKDRIWADHRAQEAMDAAFHHDKGQTPPHVLAAADDVPHGYSRCKYCGKVNKTEAPACINCGAIVFC